MEEANDVDETNDDDAQFELIPAGVPDTPRIPMQALSPAISPARSPAGRGYVDPRAFRDAKKFKKLHLRIQNLERRLANQSLNESPLAQVRQKTRRLSGN